jgi:hypothetical protein
MTQQRANCDTSPSRVDLRDTFAAAALTGYNANPAWDDTGSLIVAEQAYADADAMLRMRNGAVDARETVTLTAEEREAIYRAEARLRSAYVPDDQTAATLRKLLARLA